MTRLPKRGDGEGGVALIAERIWYGALSVMAALAIFVALVVAASASPATCNACHTAQADALAESAHAKATCSSCHAGTTSAELVASRLDVVQMVGAQIVPLRPRVAAQVDDRRCLMCHAEDLGGTATRNGVKMSHEEPLAEGWRCQGCHPQVAHGQVSMRRVGYTMDMCMGSHSTNPANIATCDVCHTDSKGGNAQSVKPSTPWRVTHGPDWEQTHGMGDLKTCRGCHQTDACVKCHDMAVPHAEGYVREHGDVVLARADARAACIVCHKAASCDNCHGGLTMPHPAGFAKEHSTLVGESGKERCVGCHAQSSCDECHARHTHPGLTPEEIRKLRSKPVTAP